MQNGATNTTDEAGAGLIAGFWGCITIYRNSSAAWASSAVMPEKYWTSRASMLSEAEGGYSPEWCVQLLQGTVCTE